MNGKKKIVKLTILAALCLGISTASAATGHWNDASLNKAHTTQTVLGQQTSWSEWKTGWAQIADDFRQVSIAPGSNEKQLNFAWYSQVNNVPRVRIASNSAMADAKEFVGKSLPGTIVNGKQYFANKVTALGFQPCKTYYYQVNIDGQWQKPQVYKTKDFKAFSFILMGDPQIGASKGQLPSESKTKQDGEVAARNDAYNWNTTLNTVIAQHPDISFILSAGDQINEAVTSGKAEKITTQEHQYAGFLSPLPLKHLPLATTIGNHDSLTVGYKNHFNTANAITGTDPTPAGNDYFFKYGDALFIVLNTNNYTISDHKAALQKAINANKNAKWKIAVIHQDVYGSGFDHSDSDGIILRTQLTPLFDENKIDVVLQGHDHTYSRSYFLKSDGKTHAKYALTASYKKATDKGLLYDDPMAYAGINEKDAKAKEAFLSQNNCYKIVDKSNSVAHNPQGTMYIEASSSTGSKFYKLLPNEQDYIAFRSQTWQPSYSVIDITKKSFKITTYDMSKNSIMDQYTIEK